MLAMLVGAAALSAGVTFFVTRWWTSRAMKSAAVGARNFAHDMRQPIQAIELYASALERRVQTDEERDIIARIHACIANAQARLARLEGKSKPAAAARKDALDARIVFVGAADAAFDGAASMLAARGAKIERVSDQQSALRRLRSPLDLVVENAEYRDPRLGVAFATAQDGKAAALVVIAKDDSVVRASLARNSVHYLVAPYTEEMLVAASEDALSKHTTSVSR